MESLGDFQSAIHRDLAWRKREISDIKSLASRADETALHIFRAGQVLLCAHWEGFLKKSVQLYIDHVFSQKLPLRNFAPNIVSIAYFRDVKKASDASYPGSEFHHLEFAKKLLATIDSEISTPGWRVDAEGNPGSEVLDRVLKSAGVNAELGMDAASWATTKVFIDEHLVRDRHKIAHGGGLPIPKVSFLERVDRLIRLLDSLCDLLLSAADKKVYLLQESQ